MQLDKQPDEGSAGGDEDHRIVKVCSVVDALDPRRIRRARERQRGKRGDRHQKDWKDRQRESTTIRGEFIQHELWLASPSHFVKQLRFPGRDRMSPWPLRRHPEPPPEPFYGYNRPGAKPSHGVICNWWREDAKAHSAGISRLSHTAF